MATKPTYEDLEKKIKGLEKKNNTIEMKYADLKESSEIYRLIIENNKDGIVVLDKDNIIYTNPSWAKLHGTTPENVKGKSLFDFTPPSWKDLKSKRFKTLKEKNPPELVSFLKYSMESKRMPDHDETQKKAINNFPNYDLDETPVIGKDGNLSWMSVSNGTISISRKEYGFHTLHDIGRQVIAEQKLRESEERYRMLFEHAGFDITLIDAETYNLVAMNNIAKESLGYCDDEINGMTIFDIEAQETPDEAKAHIEQIIKEGSDTFETKQKTKEGSIRDRLVSTVALKMQGKYYIQNISSDITELKETQRALEKAHDELEIRVEERTEELKTSNANLKNEVEERKAIEKELRKREDELKIKTESLVEMNAALKILLRKRDEDKTELEEKVVTNVKELIEPYMETIKNSNLSPRQKSCMDVIDTNLKQIIAPFLQRLSSKYLNLTPKEIQIASLIKEGKTTKDIADLLTSSLDAIEFHRKNIRKKLGIKNKKMNLRSYLLSLQ